MTYKVNDILFTKDGRKTGNVTIAEVINDSTYKVVSDYGNVITVYTNWASFPNQFFIIPGEANSTHKYYNYKDKNPELFI